MSKYVDLSNPKIFHIGRDKYGNGIYHIPPDLPTDDVVERKKGKWIIKDNPGTGWYRVTCSECGEDVTSVIQMIGFFPNAKALWDFCPYCGADMRGEEHGQND